MLRAITGSITLSSKLPEAPANAIAASLPITWAQTISVASGMHRVDLAGHDARPRLEVGQVDLGQAGGRAAGHPAQVVADLDQPDGVRAQHAAQLDERVAAALGLEVVAGLGERLAGRLVEPRDRPLGEPGRRVDAGADGGAAERQLADAGEDGLEPLAGAVDDGGVPAELLAEHHRRGVHQVRAAGLHGVGELVALAVSDVVQRGECRRAGRAVAERRRRRGSRSGRCRWRTARR